MKTKLHVLLAEDLEEDAKLLIRELRKGGFDVEFQRVEAAEALKAALAQQSWDVILCDYAFPNFSGDEALRIVRESGLDLPFIFVSGRIGEETAVQAMKSGAHDYVMKNNLARLAAAVKRELDESKIRHERRQAEDELRNSREQLRALAARLQAVREEERTRVAREIHDELGQMLTGLKMNLRSLERDIEKLDDPQLNPLLDKAVSSTELTDGLVKTVQRIAAELRPGILDRLGLVMALTCETDQFQRRTGIVCRFKTPEEDPLLPADSVTAVFRIFQESMTNVARHSHATEVEIELRSEERLLVLEIRDNGKGIAAQDLLGNRSLGVLGMQERARQMGGDVGFRAIAGGGTLVTLQIPFNQNPPCSK